MFNLPRGPSRDRGPIRTKAPIFTTSHVLCFSTLYRGASQNLLPTKIYQIRGLAKDVFFFNPWIKKRGTPTCKVLVV
jgi:hypothetical protein